MPRRKQTPVPTTDYIKQMRDAMRDKGFSLRALGRATGFTYEHIRGIVAGTSTPSREANDRLCESLGLNKATIWQAIQLAKLHHQFGHVPAAMVPPPDDRLVRFWPTLTDAEKAQIVQLAETFYTMHRILELPDNTDELMKAIAAATEKLETLKRREPWKYAETDSR